MGVVDFFNNTGGTPPGMLGGFDLWDGVSTFYIDAFGVPGDSTLSVPGQELFTGSLGNPTLLSSGGPFSFQDLSSCDNGGTPCPPDALPTGTLTVTLVPTPTPEPSSLLLLAAGLALGVVTTLLRKN